MTSSSFLSPLLSLSPSLPLAINVSLRAIPTDRGHTHTVTSPGANKEKTMRNDDALLASEEDDEDVDDDDNGDDNTGLQSLVAV